MPNAKVYSIVALILVQAFVLFTGPTSGSGNTTTPPPSTASYPSSTTPTAGLISGSSSVSDRLSSSASASVPSVSTTTSNTVTHSSPPSDTVTQSPSPSNTVIPSSPPSNTDTPTPSSFSNVTSTPSSSYFSETPSSSIVVCPIPGSVVTICLHVKVPSCNDNIHGNHSSSEIQALLIIVTINVKSTYAAVQVTVICVSITSSACFSSTYVKICIKVTFLHIKVGVYIETVLKEEIKDKSLGNLAVDDTQYSITFVGVKLEYVIKDGECQRVCCGAGGPVIMIQTCTPKDKCQGFLPKNRTESKHCHGEENDLCSSKPCPNKGSFIHSPSLALLILLTVGSFLKITAY